MAVQIQFRNDTAANWLAADPILAVGEMGIETNTNLFKIGDGSSNWTELVYGGLIGPQGETGATGATGPSGVANATSPLAYNALTQTISLSYASLVIDGGTA